MTSLDLWQPWTLDRPDSLAGQIWLDAACIAEPGFLASEPFENGRPMYTAVGGRYPDQDIANSYDQSVSSVAPFDGYVYRQDPSLIYDSFGSPIDTNTPRFTGGSYPRFKDGSGTTRSNSSTETECSHEDDQQGHICQECNKLFKNLQELDQHTKRVPHKAWRCAEPSCGKTYARRDTFLRHRAAHKDKSHPCSICAFHNKQKFFKRRDHLKEHIRNCHSKGTEATGYDGTRSNDGRVSILSTDQGGRGDAARVAIKTEQLAMDTLAKSLHTVIAIGSDDKSMLGELEDSLTTLTGSEMKKVASSMARAALEKTREASSRKSNG